MKQTLKTLALTTALSLAASLASAATAFTDPVGAVSVNCPDGSDTIVAVPFAKAADFQGTLSGAPAGGPGATRVLSITGTPGFTASQFANLWYVRFTSGPLAGRYYTITGNTTSTVTIDINGDTTVDSAVATNGFKIVKYWTLLEAFPSAGNTATNGLHVAASSDIFDRLSEVLIPDYVTSGTNLIPTKIVYPVDDGVYRWEDSADSSNVDSLILPPDGFVVVRHPVGVGAKSVVFTGSVETGSLVSPVFAAETISQDNFVSFARPKDYTLLALGLQTGVVASASTDIFDRADEVLVYNNASIGQNKIPEKIFYFVDPDWYDSSDDSVANTFVIPATAPVVVRKIPSGVPGGVTSFITNTANY